MPDFSKTHGIVRKEWMVTVTGDRLATQAEAGRTEKLRLNLWDFGGQEVYKHTHTFFLTHRAVYLLVVDARANDRQNNLEYWLEMAKSFGGGAPVWVAVNKSDEHGDGPDEHALRRKFPEVLRGFIRTSCRSGEGIEKLKQQLVAEALALEGVRQPMNNIWLGIKRSLEETKEDTIPLERYLTLCREKGETDSAMQQQLLGLWDRLGTVRYFPSRPDDPPAFRDTAILNPEWVTKAVYAVLDDAAIRERDGLILDNDLERILCACGYEQGRYLMIAQVMRRFDLLYDTLDHDPLKMLVPQLLPEKQPEIDWPVEGTLRFFYRYPVLPAALVPTFIARMHTRLSRAPSPWRHGCVLEFHSARTLVIGDGEAKQVEINVMGAPLPSREALDAVRFTFESIHGDIKDLSVEELIPVPGRPDAPLLDYRFMRDLEFNQEFFLKVKGTIPGELIEIDVRQVLSGVRGDKKKAAEAPQVVNNFNAPNAQQNFTNMPKNEHYDFSNSQFINSVVGAHRENITNAIQQLPTECAELRTALEELHRNTKPVLIELTKTRPEEAEKAAKRLEQFVEAAKEKKPDKDFLQVASKGLIDAARTVAAMAGPIIATVDKLRPLLGF